MCRTLYSIPFTSIDDDNHEEMRLFSNNNNNNEQLSKFSTYLATIEFKDF